MRSFFFAYFPVFGLNTEIHKVNTDQQKSRIWAFFAQLLRFVNQKCKHARVKIIRDIFRYDCKSFFVWQFIPEESPTSSPGGAQKKSGCQFGFDFLNEYVILYLVFHLISWSKLSWSELDVILLVVINVILISETNFDESSLLFFQASYNFVWISRNILQENFHPQRKILMMRFM